MKHTSKAFIEIMKKEVEEDRQSIDELIEQMEFKLNKRLALLENTMRFQYLFLRVSNFSSASQRISILTMMIPQSITDRMGIIKMPPSPLFKKGGEHHKYTLDECSGEFIMKHPVKDERIYPKQPTFRFQ